MTAAFELPRAGDVTDEACRSARQLLALLPLPSAAAAAGKKDTGTERKRKLFCNREQRFRVPRGRKDGSVLWLRMVWCRHPYLIGLCFDAFLCAAVLVKERERENPGVKWPVKERNKLNAAVLLSNGRNFVSSSSRAQDVAAETFYP